MIYYKHGTGTYVITEPKPWASENQHLFPDFGFTSNADEPRTEEVNKLLVNSYGFIRTQYDNPNVVVLFNPNPNLQF